MKKEKQGKNPGEMARWYIPLALVDCCDGAMVQCGDGTMVHTIGTHLSIWQFMVQGIKLHENTKKHIKIYYVKTHRIK